MSIATQAVAGRPLCALERWYWIFDQVVSLNAISRCRVLGDLSNESLRNALKKLQQRHPLLRAKVIADVNGENPSFIIDDELSIQLERQHGENPPDQDEAWIDAVRNLEMNNPFNAAVGPLLRIRVVDTEQGMDIILVASHIIADATSVISLLKELLLLSQAISIEQSPSSMPLMPSFSERFPIRYNGVAAFLQTLYLHLKLELFNLYFRPVLLPRDQNIPFAQRRNNFVHTQLSKYQTNDLISECRRRGVTVHSALCTTLMLAIAEDNDGHTNRAKNRAVSIGIGSPVNLRNDLVPRASDNEIGVFVGSFITFGKNVNKREFWDIALHFGKDMRLQFKRGEPFSILNFVRKAMPKSVAKAASFMKLIDQKGPGNACISNLGRYDFPNIIGALQVSQAQFIAETSVTGTWVSTVNTSHEQLAWNFSYSEEIIKEQRAKKLAARCIEILLQQMQSPTNQT